MVEAPKARFTALSIALEQSGKSTPLFTLGGTTATVTPVDANKLRIIEFLRVLDRELKDRRFVTGDTFTVADITGLVSVDFMKPAKLAVPDELVNLKRWHAEVAARPSATA